jgi:hypothetical protein
MRLALFCARCPTLRLLVPRGLQRDYGLRDPAARPRVCANEQPGQRAYYQSWYQRSYKQQLTMASINLCALTVIALIAQHMECILLRNPLAVSQAFAPPIIGTAGGTRPPHSFLPRCLTVLPALLREQNSKLVAFLQKAGIDDDAITEYLPKLVQNKVDEAALGLLTEQQLDKLAIPMGDLVKILEAAKQLTAAKRPATRRTKSRKQ